MAPTTTITSSTSPPTTRCDRCRSVATRDCRFTEYGKKCNQCKRNAKGCLINGTPVKIVFENYLKHVPDAKETWQPSENPSSSPEKASRRGRGRPREESKEDDGEGNEDEGEEVHRQLPMRETRGSNRQKQQGNDRSFTPSPAHTRHASRVETESEEDQPRARPGEVCPNLNDYCPQKEFSTSTKIAKMAQSKLTRKQQKKKSANDVSQGHDCNKEKEKEIEVDREPISTKNVGQEKQPYRISARELTEPVFHAGKEQDNGLFDQSDEPENDYAQLKDSIFAPYEDTIGHMQILRQIEETLKLYGVDGLSKAVNEDGDTGVDDILNEVERKPAGCCDKAYFYLDDKKHNTAKVLEAWFIQVLSHETAWEIVDVEEDPDWYRRWTTIIFSVFDYDSPKEDPRLFVLEKVTEDRDSFYTYAEVLAK